MNEYGEHQSVLLEECLFHWGEVATASSEKKLFADLTFGAGGHSVEFLKRYAEVNVIAFDQDPEAIKNGKKRIEEEKLQERLTLVHRNFSDFPEFFSQHYPSEKLSGILLDLGVSSHQFDSEVRGFSYKYDAPLDMRMDYSNEQSATAADLINQLNEQELADLFYGYGEERYSRRIAKKIVEERKSSPIKTTRDLENIIFHCYPAPQRHKKPHPATRCFQALRIAVNRELERLEKLIPELPPLLEEKSRILVISFHSLEDRIVKRAFRELKLQGIANVLTKKPIIPSEKEILENKRARSAKLRVIEKK